MAHNIMMVNGKAAYAETEFDARHPITHTMVSMASDKKTSILDNIINATQA